MKIKFNNKLQIKKHGRPVLVVFNESRFFTGAKMSPGVLDIELLESFKPNKDWGFEEFNISLADGFNAVVIKNLHGVVFDACKTSKNWQEVAQKIGLPESIIKDFVNSVEPRWADEVDNKVTDNTDFEEFVVELRKPSRQEGWQNVVINNQVFDNANCKKLDGIATIISFGESEQSQHIKICKLLIKKGVKPEIKTEAELENSGWFCQNNWGSFKWFAAEN